MIPGMAQGVNEAMENIMEVKKPEKLIGLTGPYCAGKNHVALLLERRGLAVLDVDKLGHRVIETEKERLAARFGEGIVGAGGLVDRRRLGAAVFGNPQALSALEDIIHPVVNREILAWLGERAETEAACVINAALLHRCSPAFEALDAVILVKACLPVRLLRAKKRDRLPWTALVKRFGSQRHFASQYSAVKADIYKVENSGFSGFTGRLVSGRLENRINEILSRMGIT